MLIPTKVVSILCFYFPFASECTPIKTNFGINNKNIFLYIVVAIPNLTGNYPTMSLGLM